MLGTHEHGSRGRLISEIMLAMTIQLAAMYDLWQPLSLQHFNVCILLEQTAVVSAD